MSVMKFLDIEGLSTFLNQIKNKFVSKENIDSSLSSSSTNPVQNKVINTALGNKVDKVDGKQLSTNDYTTTEKNKLAGIEDNANNYIHPSTHPASMITQDSTHRFVTDVEKQTYEDKYTKNEVDNKLSALETKIDWKESVETYDDIETTYPSPEDGWTVNVNDTDITYRYDGTSWIAISANSIPLATSSVDGKMSKTDKAKLDGIASGANNYVHPAYTSRTSGLYKVTVDSTGHVSNATAVAKSDITALGIPAQDTTYSNATTSASGLMSATDKTKLNGVATGAEVNQNAYSNVKVGATTIAADSKTDTLEIVAGSNITITPDAASDKITIAATNTTYETAGSNLGLVKSGGDVTISEGIITVNDDSHAHTISNVDGLQSALDEKSPITHTHNYAGSSSAGGAANSANKLATARTITLSGDASGSVSFDGSGNVTLPVAIVDDSHNHTISNIDGLQDALDNISGGSVSSASKWTTARNINGMSIDGTENRFNYGTCSTAAGTAAKTVACTGFTLATGSDITVKFTVTNTASNPTLNVNGTGAKAVYYNGAAITAGYLKANKVYTFKYNGTQYDLVGDIDTNTTYSLSSFGVTATAEELNYVDGVTSSIQTQLNEKLSTTGTAAKATADASGQNIADTYIKGLSVNGRTITYTKGDGTTGTITTQDTTYTHPNSGVTAGTYKSVTVNAQGHVTAGSNPTTLAGYGITDACKLVYSSTEPTSDLVANMVWIG